MAIYIIVDGIRRLFRLHSLNEVLAITVQLLNFTVLLSYPINFFIYCRMSRAFRDAFTKLLCPSLIGSREQRSQSMATPLLTKTPVANTPTTTLSVANHEQLELKTTNFDNNNTMALNSSVITNSTANELTISSLNHSNNRHSSGLRVSFDDEGNHSNNNKYTHL